MNLEDSVLLINHELYGHIMVMNHEHVVQILLLCDLPKDDMISFFDGDYIERERKRDTIIQ